MQSDQEFIASVDALSSRVGSKSIVEDEIGISMVRRIAGMLDEDPSKIKKGDLLSLIHI